MESITDQLREASIDEATQLDSLSESLVLKMKQHLVVCDAFTKNSTMQLKQQNPNNLTETLFRDIDHQVKEFDSTGSALSKRLQRLFTERLKRSSSSNDDFFIKVQIILDSWLKTQSQLFVIRKDCNKMQLRSGFNSSFSILAEQLESLLKQIIPFFEDSKLIISSDFSQLPSSQESLPLSVKSSDLASQRNWSNHTFLQAEQYVPLKYYKESYKKLCKSHSLLSSKKKMLLKRFHALGNKGSAPKPHQLLSTSSPTQNSEYGLFQPQIESINSIDTSIYTTLKLTRINLKLYGTKISFVETIKRVNNSSSLIRARLSELMHIHFRTKNIIKKASTGTNFSINELAPDKNFSADATQSFSSTEPKESYSAYTQMVMRLKITSVNVNQLFESLMNIITAFENKPLHSDLSKLYSTTNAYWDRTNKSAQIELKKIGSFFERHIGLVLGPLPENVVEENHGFELNNIESSIPSSARKPFEKNYRKTEPAKPTHQRRCSSAMSSFKHPTSPHVVKKYSNCLILKQEESLESGTYPSVTVKCGESATQPSIEFTLPELNLPTYNTDISTISSISKGTNANELLFIRPFSRKESHPVYPETRSFDLSSKRSTALLSIPASSNKSFNRYSTGNDSKIKGPTTLPFSNATNLRSQSQPHGSEHGNGNGNGNGFGLGQGQTSSFPRHKPLTHSENGENLVNITPKSNNKLSRSRSPKSGLPTLSTNPVSLKPSVPMNKTTPTNTKSRSSFNNSTPLGVTPSKPRSNTNSLLRTPTQLHSSKFLTDKGQNSIRKSAISKSTKSP